MADKSKPPGLSDLIRNWVFRRFGIPGLVVIAILASALYAYTNWDAVHKWPGISSVVAYFTSWPVPKADPHRFSVLVANLENDTNLEHKRLIVETLKEYECIQVLSLDRTISLEGPVPEEMEKSGHYKAHRYLDKSGASTLIWGTVLIRGSDTVLKLYWTASHGAERKPQRYPSPIPETQFQLPEVFWSDLADVLLLLVASQHSEFFSQDGQYVAKRLSPFIDRVRKLLEASGDRPGWGSDDRAATLEVLADALQVLGIQSGKNEPLEEAVTIYRQMLNEQTRDRVPLLWAKIQNNMGNALSILGERKVGTFRQEEAVAAYRKALKEWTRERKPLHWAAIQDNLGCALVRLGERGRDTARLEEAVATFREALKERTRERVPLKWARTQNNLGAALALIGEEKGDTARQEEAVTAYRLALTEQTRERVPLHWAETQYNLGITLYKLGQQEGEIARLKEAIAVYRLALKERSKDRAPMAWAKTQYNLGLALLKLGERESGTASLVESVAVFQAVLGIFESESDKLFYPARRNLRRAEALLHDRGIEQYTPEYLKFSPVP